MQLCVYTALVGDYEQLNEQPVAAGSAIPFICLTDDPSLTSATWQMRQVSPVFAMDAIRSQRVFKLRPHLHLSDFDASLYIDNSVVLTKTPELIFERYLAASGFCLARHSFRGTVLDEFLGVSRQGLDDQNRIFEQLNHYTAICPEVLMEKPFWGGIQLRDHRSPLVRAMLEIWLAHVLRYSRRDQLSVNLAFRQAGLMPDVMDIDNDASWFHSWPTAKGRRHEVRGFQPGSAVIPAGARIRQLEQELGEQARQHEQAMDEQTRRIEAMCASRSWRVASLVSRSVKRLCHWGVEDGTGRAQPALTPTLSQGERGRSR
jgi:hypothetical protein